MDFSADSRKIGMHVKCLSEVIKRGDEIVELLMATSHPREAFEMIRVQFHGASTIPYGIGVKFQSIVRQASLVPSFGKIWHALQ